MAHSARRVALAAIMALVVLLFSDCAHLGRAIIEDMELPFNIEMPAIPVIPPNARPNGKLAYDLTASQMSNTLKMLQAFSAAMPALQSVWTGSSFCDWEGITCYQTSVYVSLTEMSVSGTLPDVPEDVVGAEVAIETINLYKLGTAISGTLPASWGAITKLATVNLGSTSVSGPLPDAWSTLNQLSFLSMPNTQVSGTLPAGWTSMEALSVLTLYSTQVSGILPPEWSAMPELSVIQLQRSKLAGSFPDSWSAMPKLTRMALTGNDFCGCVPQSWKDSTTMRVAIDAKFTNSNCASIICVITTTTTTTTTTEAPITEEPTTEAPITEEPTTEEPTTTTPRPSTPQPASFPDYFRSLCPNAAATSDLQINTYKKYICCSDYNITGDTWKCGEDIRSFMDATVNCSAPKMYASFSCCTNVDDYGNRDFIGATCDAARGMVSALMAVAAVLAVVMSSVM